MCPSLPVSALYSTAIMTLFNDVFRYAASTEQLALKLKGFILTNLMLFS